MRRAIGRGELVRVLYRLGRGGASGVLTLTARATRAEVFVLRRGAAIVGDMELARRMLVARLARLAALDTLGLVFEGGVAGVSPLSSATHGVSLTAWAREHLEAQLDGRLAETLVRDLAGARLALRHDLAPEPADEADRRMLAAMAMPRRLDQIWPLARTPRFRLLAFVHFLRAVDALDVTGVTAERSVPVERSRGTVVDRVAQSDQRRAAALRMLGVDDTADPDQLKRAYRRLARSIHPDLQPNVDAERRRALERRFAEVTAAYESLR
jgi:DnaJ-domain-containing protein 1